MSAGKLQHQEAIKASFNHLELRRDCAGIGTLSSQSDPWSDTWAASLATGGPSFACIRAVSARP